MLEERELFEIVVMNLVIQEVASFHLSVFLVNTEERQLAKDQKYFLEKLSHHQDGLVALLYFLPLYINHPTFGVYFLIGYPFRKSEKHVDGHFGRQPAALHFRR